jgi:hypothetical protein
MNNAYLKGYYEGYLHKMALGEAPGAATADPELDALKAEVESKKKAVNMGKLQNQSAALDQQLGTIDEEAQQQLAEQQAQAQPPPQGQQPMGTPPVSEAPAMPPSAPAQVPPPAQAPAMPQAAPTQAPPVAQ